VGAWPRPTLYLRSVRAVQLALKPLKKLSAGHRVSLPLTPTHSMAARHSALYTTIAEQVSAYIDVAVTDPMTDWWPPLTLRRDELPMEVLFDYDEPFPLPTGLDSILALSETSDDHRTTMEQVLHDLLHLPKSVVRVPYHIKELRLAYRSRSNLYPFTWDIARPTPLVSNYLLLALAEGVLRRHKNNPRTPPNMMAVSESPSLSTLEIFDPANDIFKYKKNRANENPLPSYIGGKVHARLVEAKAKLNAIGFGNDLSLAA
ncbi:hypothetical protein GGX14DRAFT_479850, partial [Mycena pura]